MCSRIFYLTAYKNNLIYWEFDCHYEKNFILDLKNVSSEEFGVTSYGCYLSMAVFHIAESLEGVIGNDTPSGSPIGLQLKN